MWDLFSLPPPQAAAEREASVATRMGINLPAPRVSASELDVMRKHSEGVARAAGGGTSNGVTDDLLGDYSAATGAAELLHRPAAAARAGEKGRYERLMAEGVVANAVLEGSAAPSEAWETASSVAGSGAAGSTTLSRNDALSINDGASASSASSFASAGPSKADRKRIKKERKALVASFAALPMPKFSATDPQSRARVARALTGAFCRGLCTVCASSDPSHQLRRTRARPRSAPRPSAPSPTAPTTL